MRRIPRLSLIALLGLGMPLGVVGQGWQHIGTVQKTEKLPDGVELTAGKAKVRVPVHQCPSCG